MSPRQGRFVRHRCAVSRRIVWLLRKGRSLHCADGSHMSRYDDQKTLRRRADQVHQGVDAGGSRRRGQRIVLRAPRTKPMVLMTMWTPPTTTKLQTTWTSDMRWIGNNARKMPGTKSPRGGRDAGACGPEDRKAFGPPGSSWNQER